MPSRQKRINDLDDPAKKAVTKLIDEFGLGPVNRAFSSFTTFLSYKSEYDAMDERRRFLIKEMARLRDQLDLPDAMDGHIKEQVMAGLFRATIDPDRCADLIPIWFVTQAGDRSQRYPARIPDQVWKTYQLLFIAEFLGLCPRDGTIRNYTLHLRMPNGFNKEMTPSDIIRIKPDSIFDIYPVRMAAVNQSMNGSL